MPPKRSISKKRSSKKKLSQHTIPIYEILSTRQIREPMIDILPQIERGLKQSPGDLKMSFLNMLIRVCGLEEFSCDIQSENTIEILQSILQKAYQIKKTQISPLILDTRNRFHKDFVKRLREFLQCVISQQLGVFTSQQVQFNQSFLGWLQILTKSKLRPIRSASVNFSKILVQQQIKLYEVYHQKKQSKKALNLAKSVSYYLERIFAQRLKDVDHVIRELAFAVMTSILEQLEGDIITETLLNKVYAPLFDQDVVILDLTVKSINTLLTKCGKNKLLTAFIKDHLHKLIQLSKSVHFTGTNVHSLKTIELMHHLQPTLKILNKDYLIAVLESYAPFNLFYGLHAVVQVFYQSLYKTSAQLQANSSIVLLQIITLLMGITSQKNLNTILKTFFVSSKKIDSDKIFNVDTMFNLLLAEFYRDENNQDIHLKDKEVALLLTIISQWIVYSQEQYKHLIKNKPLYEKILQTYNNHILMNCKQLFFQKMTKHQQFADKYLNLFAHIHVPTLNFSGLENYLDFVIQKIQKLFIQDIQQTQIYKEIASVLHNLGQDEKLSQKYTAKSLISKLSLPKLTSQNYTITQSQVYRCSSLLSKFPIQELVTSDYFVCNLIDGFAKSNNQKERMEVLTILHFVHHYGFMGLLYSNGGGDQEVMYKLIRGRVIKLYLQILSNADEHTPIRLCGFRGLTYMLRTLSNKRFQDTQSGRVNAYELSSQEMKIIYDYIAQQLFNSDSLDFSSLDVTRMLQRMSLESHEIKSEIIRLLFGLYEESYVFACHAESARFIISLIRAEHDLQKESLNRSHLLPLSLDLTLDLQKRLHSLLQKYLLEQIKQSNLNKLIYWRMCFQIFTLARQDQRFEMIMDKLLSSYFSKKKLDPQQRKRLTNKLMIFILHAVDKILQKKEYIHLDVYQNILRKVYRKFDKQVLIRIKQFFMEKTQGIQSPFVSTFLQTLQTISKVQIKKSKKKEQETESDEEVEEKEKPVESQQSEDENRGNEKQTKRTGKKSRRGKSKKNMEESQIMEVEENEPEQVPVQNPRNTRSQTKKKLR